MSFAFEREMTPIVTDWLRSQGLFVKEEVYTTAGVCDLVGCSINPEAERRRVRARKASAMIRKHLSRLGELPPWLPIHDRLVLVELKLAKAAEVFRQAYGHHYLGESYAAMPLCRAERDAGKDRWRRYGVGLLGVTEQAVTVLVEPRQPESLNWYALVIAERFWRDRKKLAREEASDGTSH